MRPSRISLIQARATKVSAGARLVLKSHPALKLKFNPKNSSVGYAAYCDLGGLVTEDGGKTWRISKAKYNTNYDYAFDPGHPELVLRHQATTTISLSTSTSPRTAKAAFSSPRIAAGIGNVLLPSLLSGTGSFCRLLLTRFTT